MKRLSRAERLRRHKLGPASAPEDEGYIVLGFEEVPPEALSEVCEDHLFYGDEPKWNRDPSYNWAEKVLRKRERQKKSKS